MEALLKEKIFGIRVERLLTSCQQTLYMVSWALLLGTLIGAVLAMVLVLTRKGGIRENPVVYTIISAYINVVRSV
ncbi:MAG: methionine ABC transporter permease, partial [Aristaeellaceae bacterium]